MKKLTITALAGVMLLSSGCWTAKGVFAPRSDANFRQENSPERDVTERMKEMRLTRLFVKPPNTIADVVAYLRQASVDFDDPAIPVERRGFDIVLQVPESVELPTLDLDTGTGKPNEPPTLPLIPCGGCLDDVSFYDTLTRVCIASGFRFEVKDSRIVVMPCPCSL